MEILLLKMGEIVLKGLNRSSFESKLMLSLRNAVGNASGGPDIDSQRLWRDTVFYRLSLPAHLFSK